MMKCHRLGDITNRNFFSHGSDAGSLRSGCMLSQILIRALILAYRQMSSPPGLTWPFILTCIRDQGLAEKACWCLFFQGHPSHQTRVLFSWPLLAPIISQRFQLRIPSHQRLGLQQMNEGGGTAQSAVEIIIPLSAIITFKPGILFKLVAETLTQCSPDRLKCLLVVYNSVVTHKTVSHDRTRFRLHCWEV